MPLQDLFQTTSTEYRRSDDLDFPVSKLRLFMDVLWQHVTSKPLTSEQKVTLKQLIDLLNLLDEHKHESERELIAAMMPAIAPLLETMPTLGLTGTLVFTHLVPTYQHYLPVIESMVKDAHTFTTDEVFLYYELTIFDQLFLVHLFENEHQLNLIEMIATIKTIILMNALVYDYHQHSKARSISFFTFLARGGMEESAIKPFLFELINSSIDRAKQIVTTPACIEVMEFFRDQLIATTNEAVPSEAVLAEPSAVPELAPVTAPAEIAAPDTTATPAMEPQPVIETPTPVVSEPTPTEPAPVMPDPVAAPVVESVPMDPVTSPVHTEVPETPLAPQPIAETPALVTPPAPAMSEPVAAPTESAPQAPTFATTLQENPVNSQQ